MLKSIMNNELVIQCLCGLTRTETIGSTTEDVYMTGECGCGMKEGYNLKLPDEMTEFQSGIEDEMPYHELNQRKYVRDLATILRGGN